MTDVQEPEQTYRRREHFEDEIELIDYLRVLWKWKWLIIGGTLLCILAVAVYGFTRPVVKMYKVSTLIEIGPEAKLDSLDKIKSMIEYGIFNQQVLNDLSSLQGISNPESLTFEIAIPKGLNILDITYKTPDPDLGKAVLDSLVKQLEQEYSQQARYQLDRKLNEISIHMARLEAIEDRIDQTKNALEVAQWNSDRLSAKREANFLDSDDRAGYINIFVHAFPLVLREWIDRLVSKRNSISSKIMSEISIIKNLAAGIKSVKIAEDVNTSDEEDLILKLKSEIDSLKRDRDKITGVFVKQSPTASLLPIKSKVKRNALLAGVVGFFFLIFLAFFIEYIKNASKRTPKVV